MGYLFYLLVTVLVLWAFGVYAVLNSAINE